MDLFFFIRYGKESEFYAAIDAVDINIVDEAGANLLHAAVAARHTKIGLELMRRGIDLNWRDREGATPLHYAGTYQMVELARALLDAGGDPRPKDRFGDTPLWSAVVNAKRDLGLVDMPMRHGADPHGKNKAGRSPLDFARQIGSEPTIALLSIPAADPPRQGSIGAAARPASASAASKSWQEEFDRLWDELVPSSGQADTVQGELMRAIGRLSDEAYRNGNGNRDEGCRLLAEYLRQHLCVTTVFSADECQEINRRIDRMLDDEVLDLDGPASPYAYLTERVVRWCAARQSPLPNSKNPLLHR